MADVTRASETAAVASCTSSTSIFQKLPPELIVLIMSHTLAIDLVNLIQTDRFMNAVFNTHKAWIFKRIQVHQFPEFLEWFGDLPGFDEPIPAPLGNNRSFKQLRCLQGAVLSIESRHLIPSSFDDQLTLGLLHLLERYGGWRYLNLLNVLKHNVKQVSQELCSKLHEEIPVLNERLAKSMVLCFFNMSWNTATFNEGELEEVAPMLAIVENESTPAKIENALILFRKEPQNLQKLMMKALQLLMFRMATRLQLEDVVASYRTLYLPAGLAGPTPVQTEEDFDNLSSEILARTLLEAFFFFGVGTALQLCEEPADPDLRLAQSLIVLNFESNLQDYLDAIILGIAPEMNLIVREGSLWAAGIGFPISDWIFMVKK